MVEGEVYSPDQLFSLVQRIPALFSSFARPPELSVNVELPFPAQFRVVHLILIPDTSPVGPEGLDC